ncbi:hypothetical protein [Tenggerimyces flavus]|uniref:HTH merR-type domain-containing protein n=1 Tax=Tenggerimyces flavus TaxID=1708749 RepID=A0ABV7YEF9_9ACTN|nr:hypothetical protein [Tenggerimyces flavus]
MASSVDVVEAAGITYRQLDYWCRKGWLAPTIRRGGGSGIDRDFHADELAFAVRMGLLVRAGFPPDVAFLIAQATPGVVPLGEGARVVIDGPCVASRRDPQYRSLERGQAA